MSMKNGMNIRLPDDLRKRLDLVAEKSGLKVADLVRLASESYCAEIEKTGAIPVPGLIINMNHGNGNIIHQVIKPTSSKPRKK